MISNLLCLLVLSYAGLWESDYQTAIRKASVHDRLVLIYFSGSDWCANCVRFKKTVLEDSDFTSFVSENFVLYNADFPRKRKNQLKYELQATNAELKETYNRENIFPKVVVINPDGTLISQKEGFDLQTKTSDLIDQLAGTLDE